MYFGERNWKEIEGLTDKVAVVTLAAFEQHGHHLPLLTDAMIGTEIARRAEAELGDTALFTPTLWVGASDHHRGMPGTISVSNAVYVDLLVDIMESLVGAGFRRIFLLNAHGGNITPGRMAIYDVHLRHREKADLWIAFSSWWDVAREQVVDISGLPYTPVTHACQQETSMILTLRPELVQMDKAVGAVIPFESAFYSPDWTAPNRVDVPRAFDLLSKTGAFGHPEASTAERGEDLYSAVAEQVVAFVREFSQWPILPPH